MVPITENRNGDLHIAPTGQKPTGIASWLGENMTMGVMLAAAVSAVATLATGGAAGIAGALGLSSWVNIAAIGAGGLIGAALDKRQNEKNAEEGVTISRPTFFNRGLLTEGVLKGGLNGMVLAVAGMTIAGALASVGVPLIGAASVASLAAASPMIPVAIAGAAAMVGAVRGSSSRKQKMEKVYKQVQTAYFIQTGQVERARGLMQELGMAGPVVAAGVGVGAAGLVAASAKAKAASVAVDPSAVKTLIGVGTGLNDDVPTHEEQYIKQVKQVNQADAAVAAAAPVPQEAPNPYDFAHLEEHPALQARRSFAQAELERRAAIAAQQPGATLH